MPWPPSSSNPDYRSSVMVKFFKPTKTSSSRKKARPSAQVQTVDIDGWDPQGQGVVRSSRPVMFVEGALPGERCEVVETQRQKQVVKARIKRLLSESEGRQTPFCSLAGECGGCQLQHADAGAALTWRQQAIDIMFMRKLGVQDVPWHAPITSGHPAYRRKARLAVDARDPKDFKLGFRHKAENAVVNVAHCPVLVSQLDALLPELHTLLAELPGRKNIGHVSLLAGDDAVTVSLNLTRKPAEDMRGQLAGFGAQHAINVQIELDGNITQLHTEKSLVCTTEPGLTLAPFINDFIQVNDSVNRKMVAQAMDWLDVRSDDSVADWFCGLGNFTLSLATRAKQVFAAEGVAEMVQRGERNALSQGIDNIRWSHLDLANPQQVEQAMQWPVNKVLLDPSREGALKVCEQLAGQQIEKILYVSCNPTTLTRDAQCLLDGGYELDKVGLIEMFPYTHHMEMMALFTHKRIKNKAS